MNTWRGNVLQWLGVSLISVFLCLQARADLWATNGSLFTARSDHTATLLPNGKVLITGGESNGYWASAELFDPAAGTCTNIGSMLTNRAFHTATLLPNGKVLVAGGYGGGILSESELYDPSSGTWTTTGAMEVPRFQHTATLLANGKVLVAGGIGVDPGSFKTNSSELYDPATGTWSEVASMNTARAYHTATLLTNGQVLVVGGEDSDGQALSSVEIYDPVSDTWTTINSLNTARRHHTATLLPNGQVLVAGGELTGMTNPPSALSSTEIFDPTTGTWTTANPMNTTHEYHTATLLPNGKLLVAGGDILFAPTNSAELYDPSSGTWTNVAFLNIARGRHAATLLPSGKVLVTGGFGITGALASTETYDSTVNPATGAWSNTAPMQNARGSFPMTLLPNGKVLVCGGLTFDDTIYSNAEIYDPVIKSWTNTGAMKEARYAHTATLLPNGKVLVTGGNNFTTFTGLSSAELYDPLTGQWTETTPMNAGRFGHTATLLRNGKVLVTGGNIEGGPSSEIYDPVTTNWMATADMNSPSSELLAILLSNGKVLVMAVWAGLPPAPATEPVELYDPTTGKWAPAGSTTAVSPGFAAATLLPDGKVLLVGADMNQLPAANMYDPTSGTWTTAAAPQSTYSLPTATLLPNGKVLLVGLNFNSSASTAALFDPAINQWMDTGMLNQTRDSQAAALLPDGKVLVAGGDYASALSSAELYDLGLQSSNASAPQITSITTPINLGGNLTVNGTGFQGVSEASGGDFQNSSTAFPLVQLRSLESQQTAFLPTTNWSATSFTSLPLLNFPPGYALATVFVNGIQSTSSIVDIMPMTHYVDVNGTNPTPPYFNWTTAATNIQDAVDASADGDLVLVTNGVYATGGRALDPVDGYSLTNRVLVNKAITVQSVNGPSVTTIQGAWDTATNGPNAARCVLLTNNSALTGFTITGGATLLFGADENGGGIWCATNTAVVSDCIIISNECENEGGGVYQGTLLNCLLTNNVSGYGGGGCARSALSNCVVAGNSAADYGGGCFGGFLSNSIVSGNTAPSADGGGVSSATTVDCIISGNSAGFGGGVNNGLTINSVIWSNNAGIAGAGYFGIYKNCTIAGNTSLSGPGGIYSYRATNCIIYFNTAISPVGSPNYENDGSLDHCCTFPMPLLFQPAANFTNPPSFVNLAAGDLHLQSNSPCINAGNNIAVSTATDLDGNPRVVAATVDVGAYEYQKPASILSYAWAQGWGIATDGSADFADPDGDGLNNWEEWIAGTNPTNAFSVLAMLPPALTNSTGVSVSWQSVLNQTYYLERATNLTSVPAFTPLQSNIASQGSITTYIDTTATNSSTYFYRVGIQQPFANISNGP